MLRLVSKFTITQIPTEAFPGRDESYTFNFVNQCEINSTWANISDTAILRFPKSVYFINSQGKKVTWDGKNTGGQSTLPPQAQEHELALNHHAPPLLLPFFPCHYA